MVRRLMACALFAAWLPVAEASDACTRGTTSADIGEAVYRAEAAWQGLDGPGLQEAAAAAHEAVRCSVEPVAVADAAAYFRVRAYADFVDGRVEPAREALRAARRLQPRYRLPESLLGETHPLRRMYEAVAYEKLPEPVALPPPAEGWLEVDGKKAQVAPSDRPYVLQRFSDDGAVAQTVIVSAGELPTYPLASREPPAEAVAFAEPPAPDVAEAPAPRVTLPVAPVSGLGAVGGPVDGGGGGGAEPAVRPRTSRTLLVISVATGAAAAGSMIAASRVRQSYLEAPPEDGALDDLVRRNHLLGYGGIGLAATAVGLGAGAVIVARW